MVQDFYKPFVYPLNGLKINLSFVFIVINFSMQDCWKIQTNTTTKDINFADDTYMVELQLLGISFLLLQQQLFN